jgi:hypothetical protein
MAYWPQKQIAALLANGETGTCYDTHPFFYAAHPLNPFRTSVGTYSNIFSGTSGTAGAFAAAPIDTSVTVDAAVNNIGRVYAAIRSIKMPNGVTPRFLKPSQLLVPSELVTRAQQITKAKYIAQAAGSAGGGGADISAIISKWGFDEPLEVQEFSGVDPTTYYVVAREAATSELGAMVYLNREPFRITYYTGQGGGTGVDAILDRAKKLEWHCWGRNAVGYGHPFMLFKVKAA